MFLKACHLETTRDVSQVPQWHSQTFSLGNGLSEMQPSIMNKMGVPDPLSQETCSRDRMV